MGVFSGATFRSILKASVACGVFLWAHASYGAELAADAGSDSATNVDELTVLGSRLERVGDGPAPVTIIDRKRIDELGVATISEVLRYMPQQSFETAPTRYGAGAQAVNLRGLPVGSTLVLINGRRAIPGATTANVGFFNINSVPLAAVERVEVLSASASAVYGADAVGGVVNIVLKSHVSQPILDLRYGGADGGADEREVSITLGGRQGRVEGLMLFDYFDRDLLYGGERDRTANADYRRFGGRDLRSRAAVPGNVCVASGNLPGLSTPCAVSPGGSGVGLTPADFVATAGQTNFSSLNAFTAIVNPSAGYRAYASGKLELSDEISAFAELAYSDERGDTISSYSTITSGLVGAANPFNPFKAPVRVDFLLTDRHPHIKNREKSTREVIGFEGSLWEWDWQAAFIGTQSDAKSRQENQLNSAALAAALASSSPDSALNVFGSGPAGSDTLLRSLRTSILSKVSTDMSQFSAFGRGELFTLPAGALQVAVGAEWRQEKMVSPTWAAKRDAGAYYAEARAPLIGENGPLPFLRNVAATVAGRYDDYSDFGGTLNGQYGVEWRPTTDLLLRASYGESYRAPPMFMLYQPRQVASNVSLPDAVRNEVVPVTLTFGGNPNLEPETSTSLTVGAVWTPAVVGQPRIAVTYWQIKQESRLASFGFQTLLANEALLEPGRVVRAAPTAADVAAGRPGRLLAIDQSSANLGTLETSGVDFELRGVFETSIGRIIPGLVATYTDNYEAQDFATTPAVKRVGVVNDQGSIPKWRATGSLGWDGDIAGLTATVRYTSGFLDANTSNALNGLKIDSQFYADLQGQLKMGDWLGGRVSVTKGMVLRFGVLNLFDKMPSFSGNTGFGFDTTQGNALGRFGYVALRKAF